MHEFSLAQGLMEQLLGLGAKHQATKIVTVRVAIGANSGIVTDSFRFGFEALAGEHDLTSQTVLNIMESKGDDLILTSVEMETGT